MCFNVEYLVYFRFKEELCAGDILEEGFFGEVQSDGSLQQEFSLNKQVNSAHQLLV